MAESSNDYDRIFEKTFTSIQSYVSSGNWSIVSQKGGITVSSMPSDNGIKIYKAVGEINATPEVTLEYLKPGRGGVREKWDHGVKEINLVEAIDETSIVLHSVTKSYALGLISSRDFVDLTRHGCVEESGLYYTCGHGIDHPSCPESSKYVRGWNYPCGMLLYPTDNSKTKMYYMVQSDIKGYLPTSLVESNIPATMISLFKELQAAIAANLLSSHK